MWWPVAPPRSPLRLRPRRCDEGKVIITGSDRITDWHKLSPVVWTIPWNLELDCHYPESWIQKTAVGDYGPYAKRCEMVFINGQPVREVLATGLMERGTFTIDETRHQLRLAFVRSVGTIGRSGGFSPASGNAFQGSHLVVPESA